MIMLAKKEDKEEILRLYRSLLYGPADWNEYYPNEDTICFDLERDALFVKKDETGRIIAAISIDEDEEVDKLDVWDKTLIPSAELARLAVCEDMQNKGIAKEMMQYVFEILKAQGKKGVHILVKTGHKKALAAYKKLGFKPVGSCVLFDKDFVCMELAF